VKYDYTPERRQAKAEALNNEYFPATDAPADGATAAARLQQVSVEADMAAYRRRQEAEQSEKDVAYQAKRVEALKAQLARAEAALQRAIYNRDAQVLPQLREAQDWREDVQTLLFDVLDLQEQ
jgi:uncharacterized protein (DUF3084 family)